MRGWRSIPRPMGRRAWRWRPAQTTADVGRLPAPESCAPISVTSFTGLCEAWRPYGLWLTLWNRDGECIAIDDDAPRFWRMLWDKGRDFQEALKVEVRQN